MRKNKELSEAPKISDLEPALYNPRKISDQAVRALGKALKKFGDLSGIVFNSKTKRLVGGHQRLKHFDPSWPIVKAPHTDKTGTVALGHIATPWGWMVYREVAWPAKKEQAANIAANKHSGEWDIPKLKNILTELDDGDFDLDLIGFTAEELKELLTPEEKKLVSFMANTITPEFKYSVVVDCNSEKHQAEMIEKLEKEGLTCRPLIL